MSLTRHSTTMASYTSVRCHYRLLALTCDGNGAWMVIPDGVTAVQPSYFAVPQTDAYGFEIRRGTQDGPLVGYSMNLSDAAWPVETDLIKRGVTLTGGGR